MHLIDSTITVNSFMFSKRYSRAFIEKGLIIDRLCEWVKIGNPSIFVTFQSYKTIDNPGVKISAHDGKLLLLLTSLF